MISAYSIDEKPAQDPVAALRLYQFGCGALAAATAFFLWSSGGELSLPFILGLAILYLSSVPALLWAKHHRPWFPAFEITLLTCIAFYAIPLLNNHRELDAYPPGVIAEAAGLVISYLSAANLAFFAQRNPARAPLWASQSLLPDSLLRYLPLGMAVNTIYLYVDVFTLLIPYNLSGSVRALFFGIGIVSTFVLCRLWGVGRLDRRAQGFFVANLALQLVFLLSQLYLIRAISLLALGLIAYSAARRRVPWLILALGVPVLALLHNGKSEMRRIYWEEQRTTPTVTELPAFFGEWISHSVKPAEHTDETLRGSSIFERASLIQMLCLSVDRVPSLKPFLDGVSYMDIPALFIPRFIWPDKPSSLFANVRLALHFDLIDPDDPYKVSIAFGMIAEAYLNFGIAGPPLLGLLFGFGFKRVAMLAQDAPQFSALGMLMILLTAWSFQAEFVLATWLSSLFQAAVVCVGLPLAYRKFTTS